MTKPTDNKPDLWPTCPFCGTAGLTASYHSTGTHLDCAGCGGIFVFPAFPDEIKVMWRRTRTVGHQHG